MKSNHALLQNNSRIVQLIITLMLLAAYFDAQSQFAIVSDSDGFVNIRDNAGINSNIIDTLQNTHLIYCFESKNNWTNIDYTHQGKEMNGYVYKNKCRNVYDFVKIPVYKNFGDKIILKKDSISVTLTSSMFDKKKHHFKYLKDYPDQIDLIDNKKYWGTDGEMPRIQFDKIIIAIGNKKITFPEKATIGLYQPNLYSAEVNYDIENNTIYIQTLNSDGAGSYEVIWKVVDGNYKERLVVYGF